MAAGKYDFEIEQGATFRKVYGWKQPTVDGQPVDISVTPAGSLDPVDLTGATAKMQAWDKTHTHKLIDFNVDGSVDVNGPAGIVTVELLDDKTSELTFDLARYDLKITSPNTDKTRLIQGFIRLSPQETV